MDNGNKQYDKISNRLKENGRYVKWETCDGCGKSFGADLDDVFWAFDCGDIICAQCVVDANPSDNLIENYEEMIGDAKRQVEWNAKN